ncbi:methyltransferase domain-containing protein [Methanofollis aquaemaris]|uniref:Methyltransferase domain-containing protein n=1 Tax=Methanofollis aquaemaris TaxID=126734 RepID=A0A8A3S7X2_9EURY|nr:methyltransferase domain-containing protein [Methanofollis aquaemaris]QSZ67821.1 methyltransferase domain-containing protein [Methanofollis aquaemaris]
MEDTERPVCRHGEGGHGKRSPSSFWMHDPDRIFQEVNLKKGDVFLDLGCGAGEYSLYAAREVGDQGSVIAVDIREDLADALMKKADLAGLKNITATVADLSERLPFDDDTIDVCFLVTVLHALDLDQVAETLFSDIRRVLKRHGRLVVIECKKEEMHFGPPFRMRISAEELEPIISHYGFERIGLADLGYNYMISFCVPEART